MSHVRDAGGAEETNGVGLHTSQYVGYRQVNHWILGRGLSAGMSNE